MNRINFLLFEIRSSWLKKLENKTTIQISIYFMEN